MKNVKCYSENAFDFHKEIIKRKRNSAADPDYKTRLAALDDDIELLYKVFDEKFKTNELQALTAHGYKGENHSDLLSLYAYKNKLIQKLKIKLTTTETNRIINTCQNCTINEINSFDHFIPKSEFSEFVVNPKNLFPSCTTCNSFKLTAWRKNGKRIFLNLYIDTLPQVQYLFVNIKVKSEKIETTFYVENRSGIDSDLFTLIDTHYNKLELCPRFSGNNDSVITPLKNTIESFVGKLQTSQIKKSVLETSKKNMLAFGNNYWKSVLEIALVNDKDFMQMFN